MSGRRHILAVDDERGVRNMLQRYLEQEGFEVTLAGDGAAMREVLAERQVDVILLDLGLPDANGLELAREVRMTSDIPIIMLTGRGEMVDRVVGLELGADDYVAKPFHLRELLARIRTVLRRAGLAQASAGQVHSNGEAGATDRAGEEVYCFAGWRFEPAIRGLTGPDGKSVELTRGEFDLLRAFVQAPQRTLSRDVLMDYAKGRSYEAYDRAIAAQVARLRKKIEAEPAKPMLIKSVRGVGYYFAAKVERS